MKLQPMCGALSGLPVFLWWCTHPTFIICACLTFIICAFAEDEVEVGEHASKELLVLLLRQQVGAVIQEAGAGGLS